MCVGVWLACANLYINSIHSNSLIQRKIFFGEESTVNMYDDT